MLRALFLISLTAIVAGQNFSCPAGYTTNDSINCYKVYSTPKTKQDAFAQCHSDGALLGSQPYQADGAYLTSVLSGFENTLIHQLGFNASLSAMWLGIECTNSSLNSCLNDDLSKYRIYNNFAPGNPTGQGECVYMVSMVNSKPGSGSWYSADCKTKMPFICKYSSHIIGHPTCPPGYSWFNQMCYMMNTEQKNYFAATIYCGEQVFIGGYLASVNSYQLNDFLMKLTSSYGGCFWIGLTCDDVRFVGDISSCKWQNYLYPSVNYNNFVKMPSPNNGCTYLYGNAWLSSTCFELSGFICEANQITA